MMLGENAGSPEATKVDASFTGADVPAQAGNLQACGPSKEASKNLNFSHERRVSSLNTSQAQTGRVRTVL